MSGLHWFLRWLAWRFVLIWPIDWWPFMLVLPYAGDFAYQDYATFCAGRKGIAP
jgi:hypothetical protein